MTRRLKRTTRPKFGKQEGARRKALGRLLRRARKQAHLSQEAVRRMLGYCQQNNISHIETGKRLVDLIEVENFAHLYGKSLADFATWCEKDQPSTDELRALVREHKQAALTFQRKYYKPRRRQTSSVPQL